MIQNILHIFRHPKYLIAYIVLGGIFGFLWWNFTDLALMRGNNGETYYIIDMMISITNILIFPLFIVAWFYRSYTLWNTGKKESAGFFGGIIGVLVSGSLCCGSSLLLAVGASGLVGFFSKILPCGGLELKAIGVIILLIATYFLLKNPLACKAHIKKKK